MKQCPKCHSSDIRKDGFVRDRQRYKCKNCQYHFTVKQIGKPLHKKQPAIILYLAGIELRRIGELIKVSHVAVFNWIKSIRGIKKFKSDKIEEIEKDDLISHLEESIDSGKTNALLLVEFREEEVKVLFSQTKE